MVKVNAKESFYLERNVGSRRNEIPFIKVRKEFSQIWFSRKIKESYLNPFDLSDIEDSFHVVEHYNDVFRGDSFTWQSDKWIPIQLFCDQPINTVREDWMTFNEITLQKFRYSVPRNPRSVLNWKSHIGKCLLLEFYSQKIGIKICKHLNLFDKLDFLKRGNIQERIKYWDEYNVKFEFSPYEERTRVNLENGLVKPTYKEILVDEG